MENKNYEKALIQQANLENTFYNYTNNLQPCAYFWKQLVKGKQTPSLLVPDTLLLNDKESPLIWIYTNSKGKLQKSTNINLKDFVNKVTNYCSPNQLAAILKRVTFNDNYINGNDVKLLNARYLQNASFQQLGGQNQSLITIQRYIKSNGNNPFICRTIWRRDRRSQCFIVTSKKSYFDQNQPQIKRFLVKVGESQKAQHPSRIVKAIQGKHLTQTGRNLQSITSFMKVFRGIDISEIVGDFIKDEAGNWWLINVKAFQVDSKLVRNPQLMVSNGNNKQQEVAEQGNGQKYEKEKYQKTKICRYCEKSYLQSQLTHYMTIKMLIQTDRYLLHLGKDYKWLRRSDIMNVDTHCLYQQHKICQRCYQLYMQIQELMQVENEFLKSMGFVMDKTPKELLMSLTNQEQLKIESKNKELQILASCFQNSRNSAESAQSGFINSSSTGLLNAGSQNHHNITKFNKTKATPSGFPKTIQLGPNSNIIFDDNDVPIKNDHMINKMIRYRFILYFKQLDQLELPPFLQNHEHLNYNFFIEYELFGVKNRLKLDFANNLNQHKKTLQVKKLKINYFFAHSAQDVHQYINTLGQEFNIKIYAEHKNLKLKNMDSMTNKSLSIKNKISQKYNSNDETNSPNERSPNKRKTDKKYTIMKNVVDKEKRILLGKLTLSVNEFLGNMLSTNGNKITKKDFYKFFSVNEVAHGWGLEGSIGIIPSQSFVNTSRMIFFSEDHLIYLPSDNYYYCEHLPEEWVDVVKKQLGKGSNGDLWRANGDSLVVSARDKEERMKRSHNTQNSSRMEMNNEAKKLLNEHLVSSKTINYPKSQKDENNFISNQQKVTNPITRPKNNQSNQKIKIQEDHSIASQTIKNQDINSQSKVKFNQDLWKNLILKDQILNYQKTTQIINKKNSPSQKLEKKNSHSKLQRKTSNSKNY